MFSIKNALDAVDLESQITFDHKTILEADGLVLPGVGSFPEAMRHLNELQLIDVIKQFIATGKPFMGICLGLQLLFSKSEELEECSGMGIIKGSVQGFSKYIIKPVPHVGWNTVKNNTLENPKNFAQASKIMFGENEYYYFVHSYFVVPENSKHVHTWSSYGSHDFCSSVATKNIFACQFHPEKSGPRGLNLLKNFFSKANL